MNDSKELVPVKNQKRNRRTLLIMKALPKKETTKAAVILFKMYMEKMKTQEDSEFIQERIEEIQNPENIQ